MFLEGGQSHSLAYDLKVFDLITQVLNYLLFRLDRLKQQLLLIDYQIPVRLHRRQPLIQHVQLVGLLLGLRFVNLPHNLLLFQMLDLFLLREHVFSQFGHNLSIFQLNVRHLSLMFLAQLLSELLDGAFMLGSQIVHGFALLYQFGAELVLQLGVHLVLLPQLLENLAQVAPAEPKQLHELLLALCIGATRLGRGATLELLHAGITVANLGQ